MWFATHALAGMALSHGIDSVPLLAVLGLGSHIVLDRIPHRDVPSLSWALLDIAGGVGIGSMLWWGQSPGVSFLWGAFFACLPDAEVLLTELGITRKNHFPSHHPRWHGTWSSPWGHVPNLLVGALCLLAILSR